MPKSLADCNTPEEVDAWIDDHAEDDTQLRHKQKIAAAEIRDCKQRDEDLVHHMAHSLKPQMQERVEADVRKGPFGLSDMIMSTIDNVASFQELMNERPPDIKNTPEGRRWKSQCDSFVDDITLAKSILDWYYDKYVLLEEKIILLNITGYMKS